MCSIFYIIQRGIQREIALPGMIMRAIFNLPEKVI